MNVQELAIWAVLAVATLGLLVVLGLLGWCLWDLHRADRALVQRAAVRWRTFAARVDQELHPLPTPTPAPPPCGTCDGGGCPVCCPVPAPECLDCGRTPCACKPTRHWVKVKMEPTLGQPATYPWDPPTTYKVHGSGGTACPHAPQGLRDVPGLMCPSCYLLVERDNDDPRIFSTQLMERISRLYQSRRVACCHGTPFAGPCPECYRWAEREARLQCP